jgi:uncharacterized pyridoxal phosphate-containing UPF0001 family protein
MSIQENLNEIKANIAASCEKAGRKAEDVTILAVTKTIDADRINEAVSLGLRDLGENRVQELISKYDDIKGDVRWHLIGHLQKNKVKYIADKVCMIHSVESYSLMEEIEKQCSKIDKIMDILIEVNVSGEESKTPRLSSSISAYSTSNSNPRRSIRLFTMASNENVSFGQGEIRSFSGFISYFNFFEKLCRP